MTNDAKLVTMARYIARKRIIAELRANGVKLQSIEPADIVRATNALLDAAKHYNGWRVLDASASKEGRYGPTKCKQKCKWCIGAAHSPPSS